jgi:GTPase SAR1 family protein
MRRFKILKDRLLALNADILNILDNAQIPDGIADSAFQEWRATCLSIDQQTAEDVVRIAVVGPIKSGKSTIVNALFRGDYLKRGAGVVTSMVTRARSGDQLVANLFFKPWADINADLSRAVIMLPAMKVDSDTDGLDIRNSDTRLSLSQALANLPRESLIARDSRNINSVLLSNYLAGYDRVQSIISDEIGTRRFTQDDFGKHREFVADDGLAVYLKDIQLEINSGNLDASIEIADCQGSDSPNPLHLAKIQDYLLITNLIVYVISSRTGVRQADINFLSMIDRMGISDNLLFVVNCDFNEHESQEALDGLIQRVTEEIGLIKLSPEVHAFSGLFHLFRDQGESSLSEKDARMLEQWRQDGTFVAASEKRRRIFEDTLRHKLNRRRYSLLLKNHTERLSLVASGLHQWAAANLSMLAENEESAQATFASTKRHKERLERAGAMFKNTLDGSARKLKKDLKSEIDRFFDPRSGEVLPEVSGFIRNYTVDLDKYESSVITSGFSNTLYMIFQEFKQNLDSFMAKTINPKIMGFVKKQEGAISDYFEVIAGSYDVMARDALTEYRRAMTDLGLAANMEEQQSLKMHDLELIKKQWQLQLPPAVFIMNYTGKIRTEAVMRLGVYSIGKMVKKLFKRPIKKEKEGELRALKDGMGRIKHETEASLTFHFKSYRENIKFQYVLKLAEAVSESFYKTVLDRFSAYSADLSNIRQAVSERRVDKEQLAGILESIKQASSEAHEEIRRLIAEIETAELPVEDAQPDNDQ